MNFILNSAVKNTFQLRNLGSLSTRKTNTAADACRLPGSPWRSAVAEIRCHRFDVTLPQLFEKNQDRTDDFIFHLKLVFDLRCLPIFIPDFFHQLT
jgi:hypothetical protein